MPGVPGNEEEGIEPVAGLPPRVVVIGGRGASGLLSDVWVLDTVAMTWSSMEVRAPWCRVVGR